MDSTAPSKPSSLPATNRHVRVWSVILGLCLLLYSALLIRYVGAYAGGADSSGYLNNARLLREGHLKVERRTIEGLPPNDLPAYVYVPLGFAPVGQTEMVPTYPIGLSLFMAGLTLLVGPVWGPHLTMCLHALAGICLFYALARRFGLGRFGAVTGALLLGASPLYLFMTLQAMSDVPALVWCMAAIYGAWRSRDHSGWSVVAGIATAVAVIIRPTNVLIFLPVAVCLGLNPRRWVGLIVGGAPGALLLALLNHALYGKYLTTGYGDVSSSFSLNFLQPALDNYVHWLPVLLTPGLILLLALPWTLARQNRLLFAVVLLWAAPFICFYAFYYHTHETWWYLRFILPAFPAVIMGILFAGQAIARRWKDTTRGLLAFGCTVGILGWFGYWTMELRALEAGTAGGEQAYPDAARWARASLPANAVIFCMQASGALRYYTDFILVRWDQRGSNIMPKVAAAAAAAGRPIYAMLFPFETSEALEKEIPGHWTQVGAMRHVAFWRFDGLEPRSVAPAAWHYLASARLGSIEATMRTADGWYNVEQSLTHTWAWSHGHSKLDIETAPPVSRHAHLAFGLRGFSSCTVTVKQNGKLLWQGLAQNDRSAVEVDCEIVDGRAELEFSTDATPEKENTEKNARELTFAVYSPKLTFVGNAP